MVKRRRPFPWLLACGALLSPWSAAPPGALARAEEPEGAPAAAKSAGDGDRPAEAPGPAPGAKDGGKDPAPAPARRKAGGEADDGAGSLPEDEGLAMRVLEIEGAIWREIESVESRLERIKQRLGSLRGARAGMLFLEDRLPGDVVLEEAWTPESPPPPGAPAKAGLPPGAEALVVPGDGVVFFSTGDERRYVQLLRRQDDLLRRWRRVVPSPGGRGARRVQPADGGKEREALRDELRAILTEILDVREKARERQIEGLRREISDIERAIDSRRDEAERRRLVEGRLEDLLGTRPP